jgi:cobalt/nickel transport protein
MNKNRKIQKQTILWGLVLSLATAVFLSPWASSLPDGLERGAEKLGFLKPGQSTGKTLWEQSPLPDYSFPGIKNRGLATALSGLLGTLALAGLGWGIALILKRKKN